MEHKDFRILGLAGSLRRASFHRGILRADHEVADVILRALEDVE